MKNILPLGYDLCGHTEQMCVLPVRESRFAIRFYLALSALIAVWWIWMYASPNRQLQFFGTTYRSAALNLLLMPDLIAMVAGGVMVAFAIGLWPRQTSALAWAHFGAIGYATLISAAMAWTDPTAYFGFAAMLSASGSCLAFCLAMQGANVLWGPFAFRLAVAGDAKRHWHGALRQTALLWTLFLGVIPLAIASFEGKAGWSNSWIQSPARIPLGIATFLLCAFWGLWAASLMATVGDGTPLPGNCATKLVTVGPYRHLRNPMAVGGIGQGLGVALMVGSTLLIVYSLLGAVWWELLVRSKEEAFLSSQFGESYQRYKSLVFCWRPRIRPYENELQ